MLRYHRESVEDLPVILDILQCMAGNDQKDTTVLHVAGGSSGGSAAAVAANLVSMYE
jgi:cephalosporin-C deacetylase-like acetyl esterase